MLDRRPRSWLLLAAAAVALFAVSPGMAHAQQDDDASWTPGEPVDLERIGAGDLLWRAPQGLVPLPAVEIVVEIDVRGAFVAGELTQQFVNPTDQTIEAVYVFPVPDGARVHRMSLVVGERVIRAAVHERDQARRSYEQARDEGRAAALVATRTRTGLFSTSVANIPPGERVAVRLGWLEELEPDGDRWSLRVPLAYTPRYGAPRARSAASPARSRPARAVRPSVRIGVDVSAGVAIDGLDSTSHPIEIGEPDRRGTRRVESPPAGLRADADFVLRWRTVLPERPLPFVVVERTDEASYVTAMLWPPRVEDPASYGLSTETVFVVDVSGSMRGGSIEQARQALAAALGRLRPGDRFNVIRFNQASDAMYDLSRRATPQQLDEAVARVLTLEAGGGTEIHGALSHALDLLEASPGGVESRIVLLTDGAVGRSDLLLEEVRRRLGDARLHAIGIGHAPNGRLLRALASFGRGTTAFIGSAGEVADGVERFFRRLERPVVGDLQLEWEGLHPDRAVPERIPDVYAGRPLWVHARLFDPNPVGRLLLRGRLPSGPITLEVPIDENTPQATGLATRWAAGRIEGLLESLVGGADEAAVRDAVVELGVRHGVVSPYTSLVAVDEQPATRAPARHTARLNAALPRGGSDAPLRRLAAALLGSIGLLLVLASGCWRPRCAG